VTTMRVSGGIEYAGNVRVEVRCARTGALLDRIVAANKIVNNGLLLARDLFGGVGMRPDEIALGTGTGATTDAQASLTAEVFRKTIDRRDNSGTYGIDFQAFVDTGDANGFTLAEVGLFESETLVGRAILSPTVAKTSAITLTVSYVVTPQRPVT